MWKEGVLVSVAEPVTRGEAERKEVPGVRALFFDVEPDAGQFGRIVGLL